MGVWVCARVYVGDRCLEEVALLITPHGQPREEKCKSCACLANQSVLLPI